MDSLIKQTRKEQSLTQIQLATSSGVGVRFIRELETGKESRQIGKAFSVLAMMGLDMKVSGEKLSIK